jgi:hypothetical protein
MPMISDKDAALLAYLARHKNASLARKRKIRAGLKGNALAVAKALTGQHSTKAGKDAAFGLFSWAADNDKIARKRKAG